jgi:hypothetical protein
VRSYLKNTQCKKRGDRVTHVVDRLLTNHETQVQTSVPHKKKRKSDRERKEFQVWEELLEEETV